MTFIKVFFCLGMIFAAIYLSILDIKTQKIPRLYSYIFVGFSILGGFFVTRFLLSTIIAGFLGFGLFFLVRKITKNKLGLADCFFSSGIGFFFRVSNLDCYFLSCMWNSTNKVHSILHRKTNPKRYKSLQRLRRKPKTFHPLHSLHCTLDYNHFIF